VLPLFKDIMVSSDDPTMSYNVKGIDAAHKADKNSQPADLPGLGSLNLSDPATDATTLASDMQQRCQLLLHELEQFEAHLRDQKKQSQVELRAFKSFLQSEMRMLDKVSIECDFVRNFY
jgi:hypothetical protein